MLTVCLTLIWLHEIICNPSRTACIVSTINCSSRLFFHHLLINKALQSSTVIIMLLCSNTLLLITAGLVGLTAAQPCSSIFSWWYSVRLLTICVEMLAEMFAALLYILLHTRSLLPLLYAFTRCCGISRASLTVVKRVWCVIYSMCAVFTRSALLRPHSQSSD